ncbi:TetR/AcrR family transcriptional regulator [Endomicrobium sp. AH-315-J14]|nr:TetR/AcrR family transcriptional regulator [Endomicrobium sp. AH-315-J14]
MARPREFDEVKVVQNAMHVFWEKGYQATSVQDLVDATGLQRGSIYGAFGDKHGLFLEALNAYAENFVAQVRELLTTSDDPVEALREFVRGAGVDCEKGVTAKRGCLVGNTCSELVAHDEEVRARVEVFVSAMRQTMADALRRGQAMGTFGKDRDPDAVAAFIQCSLQGLALLAKSRPKAKLLRGVVNEVLHVLD